MAITGHGVVNLIEGEALCVICCNFGKLTGIALSDKQAIDFHLRPIAIAITSCEYEFRFNLGMYINRTVALVAERTGLR
jgi:hypothetical protein